MFFNYLIDDTSIFIFNTLTCENSENLFFKMSCPIYGDLS